MLLVAFSGNAKPELRLCLLDSDSKEMYQSAMKMSNERYGNQTQFVHELVLKIKRGAQVMKMKDKSGSQNLVKGL